MKDKFIPAALIERVHREIKLLDIVADAVSVTKVRNGWRARCPFHESTAQSLRVVADGSKFSCPSCGAEGDAIDFVKKLRSCSFREAVFSLCALTALERAAQIYEEHLWSSAENAAGTHVRTRNISEETARKWRLGYAPDGWTHLVDRLVAEGFPIEALAIAGLVVARQNGKGHYDRFRARLMIPIRRRGRVLGFGARALNGEDPKYLNSPETIYFKKSETLFGVDETARSSRPLIVEGYFDAIALQQAGIPAVALCGSAFSERHLSSLTAAGFRDVCFAFDGDRAGREAASRAVSVTLGSTLVASFLECPVGLDPDELVATVGEEELRARVSSAPFAADFYIEKCFGQLRDGAGIESKVTALANVADRFSSAKLQFSAPQMQRLTELVGCDRAAVEKFLRDRKLVA